LSALPDSAAVTSLIITDRTGCIKEIDEPAARLLNLSPRRVATTSRQLAIFFDGSRDVILAAQRSAGPLASDPITGIIRPLGRRPRAVSTRVRELANGSLEWTILIE
jgi:hypothetical protein